MTAIYYLFLFCLSEVQVGPTLFSAYCLKAKSKKWAQLGFYLEAVVKNHLLAYLVCW